MSRPAHQGTTRNIGALYPFATEPGLGAGGVLIGRDLVGGGFYYDPFKLYRAGLLTNPNMLVLGQIGRGKSAFVKSYLWRQAAFGRRAWVVDPKGEYGALAEAWGVKPLALSPGGRLRLNPLEVPANEESPERRRAELLCSLAAASLNRTLSPSERTAVELAVQSVSGTTPAPTLPAVVEALLVPSKENARSVRTDVAGLASDARQVALELRRLVSGDMRGMFDGPTTPGLDLDASLVVLDLSAVFHSSALEVLMTCATAWMHAALAGKEHPQGSLVVVDEAWAILANLGGCTLVAGQLEALAGVGNRECRHPAPALRPVGCGRSRIGAGGTRRRAPRRFRDPGDLRASLPARSEARDRCST